jgi:hypothetical protein
MSRRFAQFGRAAVVVTLTCWTASLAAAPRIANVSLRGLQSGAVSSIVVDGSELGPESQVWFSAPGVKHTIKPGATPQRLEIEFTVEPKVASGIYLLRIASPSGISDPVALAVDALPQVAFTPQVSGSNVAMTGALEGSGVLTATLAGKKGQRVVIEVESRRLGSKLDPVIHLYDARRVQLAWGQALASIAGDARLVATLPADGQYTIEIHDALYRGGSPGFFRMKVGEFQFADLVYPLAIQRNVNATVEFAGTNLPAEARASGVWPSIDGRSQAFEPAPWPDSAPSLSGSRPALVITDHAEMVEPPAGPKLPELSAAPVAVSGRLINVGEQDRYRLPVTPGAKLRFDVRARRAGSPLDAVLSIQNEQGSELAADDDRPGTSDPGLDFTVPADVQAIVVAVRDLQGRGGPDFVYRVSATPIGPDFSLSLADAAFQVPRDGSVLARVKIDRAGYNGPVKLSLPDLPTSVAVALDEIPAGATEAFVTLSAPGLSPAQAITKILGSSTDPALTRAAKVPADTVNTHQPWLRDQVAVAVTTVSPFRLAWDLFSPETKMAVATALPVKFRVDRGEAKGVVRLTLLTTQVTPRKKVKVNNVDQEVDDVDRMLRFQAAPTIAAEQSEIDAKILIPADLAQVTYDLAIQADLLAADGKNVVASVVSPARRLAATTPIALELVSQGPIEVRAGVGPTGKVSGKVQRTNGFSTSVHLTLVGLPKELPAPALDLSGDKTDFEIPIAFPYGSAAGELANVKLVATAQPDPKNDKLLVRSNEIPLALKVVPGEKPAPEKPLAVFEDQVEFLASLTQGGGQASLIADQKYSGLVSIKVTPDQKFNPTLPGLGVKIRERPAPGEFRFLRFAWKKQGGQAICLQLNHDGQWGPAADKPGKFRYHAGPGGECFGASVAVDTNLPAEFVVVTRDLFADFGEFTLNGIALSTVDGEYALFDHIYLGTKPEDFDLVKPKP